MSSQHTWADEVWTDPDGGTVVIHGTLPTVVFPNAMRPRGVWHGLAILDSHDVVDLGFKRKKTRRNLMESTWLTDLSQEAPLQGTSRVLNR